MQATRGTSTVFALVAFLPLMTALGRGHAEEHASAEPVADGSVVRDVWPGHYDLFKTRIQTNRQMIEASLRQPNARPVTVAVWQMRNCCGGEQGKRDNLRRMIEAVERAGREGVQILALPEMCLPGYFTQSAGTPAEAATANRRLADEPSRSDYLKQLCDAARANRIVLAFGFCEMHEGKLYNSIGVIDADGACLGARRKNPLSPGPYDLESFTEPPPQDRCVVFRTRYATVGVLNCFDGEFPETARRMRLAGAELLLWCNAATGNVALGSSNRIHHSASYAQANRMWVACCNAVGKECYGTSVIVGPSGEPLVVLPTDREVFGVATINLSLGADWDRWRQRLDPYLASLPVIAGEPSAAQ
ncbi:MAG: carbon-nitrogen hydrolase family protein, partial [Pirellulales bacterium]|nr:carbon-nitrogen hydrolase family protein [Pirellulales bacterium]